MDRRTLTLLGLSCVFVTSVDSIKADWLDDLADIVAVKKEWNYAQASTLLKKYSNKAAEQILKFKHELKKQESGFWGTMHSGAYRLQLSSARAEYKYYKHVARFINSLPDNKNHREKLLAQLLDLDKLAHELAELKQKFSSTQDTVQKIKVGATVGAKQAEISAKKAYIKTSFMF